MRSKAIIHSDSEILGGWKPALHRKHALEETLDSEFSG